MNSNVYSNSDYQSRVRASILGGANTTNFASYNPGYRTDVYMGASSFYGDQSRLWEFSWDGFHRERNWFIPAKFKAIGRQLTL